MTTSKTKKSSATSAKPAKSTPSPRTPARLDAALSPNLTNPPARTKAGTFPKGYHPDRQVGRKPGSKNKITFLRLELEEALRNQLRDDGMDILNKAISMAKAGNEKVIKVLLDKMLASPKGEDSDSVKDNDVRITIQNLTHGEQKTQIAATPRVNVLDLKPEES